MEWFIETVARLESLQKDDYTDMMTAFGVVRDPMEIIRDQLEIIRDRLEHTRQQQMELTSAVRRGFTELTGQIGVLSARVQQLEAGP